MFGIFIVLMNTTMFNVSIPGIIENFNITADLGSWVISGYSIGYALSAVIYSRLSDSIALGKLVTVGLIRFILGIRNLCARFQLADGSSSLQSAGAGTMSGLGVVMASRYIPYERRGRVCASS